MPNAPRAVLAHGPGPRDSTGEQPQESTLWPYHPHLRTPARVASIVLSGKWGLWAMVDKVGKVAGAIAQNLLLMAVARVAMALALPAIIWFAGEVISLERRLTTSEAVQAAISSRLEDIEAAARVGAAADNQSLASVAVLQAGQQHTLQMLGVITDNLRRVERRLDDVISRSSAQTAPCDR